MILLSIYLLFGLIINFTIFFYPLKIGKWMNLIDKKSNAILKIHSQDTPKIGGVFLMIFVGFFLFDSHNKNEITNAVIMFYFVITSYFIIGLIDDYIDLSPLSRILLFSLVIYIASYIDKNIVVYEFYSELFGLINIKNELSLLFTIFCFIFLQNIINMLDGINGSLLTHSLIFFIIITFINFNFFNLSIVIAILMLLYLNIKNLLFLGNNGSSLIAALIGLSLIENHNLQLHLNYINILDYNYLSGEKILILFFLPIVDLTRVFAKRIINQKSPFKGDLNHFHHVVFLKQKYLTWATILIIIVLSSYFISYYVNSYIVILINFILYVYLLRYYR